MAAGDVLGQVLGDLDLSAGGGAFSVGGDGHKVQGAGQVDGAAQVGHEDEGAAQNADKHNLLAGVVQLDLPGDLGHPGLELLLAEQDLLNIFLYHEAFLPFRMT